MHTGCGFTNVDAGVVLSAQTAGDCRQAACDGDGGILLAIDDTDLPADDGSPCTNDTCAAGTPVHPPKPQDTACTGGVCNATGLCVQCNVVSQCAGADTACGTRACLAGSCVVLAVDAGTPLATQTPGDCQQVQCAGDGGTQTVALDSDVPADDGSQCTAESCSAGAPLHTPRATDTPCTQNGGTVCDAFGSCVQCNTPAQCGADSECQQRSCILNVCGTANRPFGTPLASQTPGDCMSNVCDGAGNSVSVADNADLPADDGNACTRETCVNGAPSHPALPVDAPCPNGVCSNAATCVRCNSSSQCGPSTECAAVACTNNACLATYADAGLPITVQTPGDCRQNQCDGDGGVMTVSFDTDLPPDEPNQCTDQVCTSGVPSHPNLPAGTACSQMGGSVCDGTGSCVTPPAVTSTTPADSSTPTAGPTLAVAFNVAMDPSSLTAQTTAGTCSGSVQVSLDDFASCIAFASAAGAMSNGNTTVSFAAAPGLLVNRTYKLRVTPAATSGAGFGLGAQFTTPNGFTTTSPNLCDGSLVISQAYGGGGNVGATYTNDFVELHNRGPTPISLAGRSIQYASAAGSSWTSLSLSGTVAAGGYYLVQLGSGGAIGAALPTPDLTGAINMNATAGKVALVGATAALSGICPSTNIIDFVGYGTTANCFEGASFAPAGSNTLSVLRPLGCEDTNDNSSNFTAVAPVPHNSATPAAVCACTVQNESNATLEADYCALQFPTSLTVQAGATSGSVFGQLYEAGVTEAAGADSNVRAQLGFGSASTNPQYESGWTWTNAAYNVQVGNNDEYQATFTVPPAGTYRYTYRFSLDRGVSWTVCDSSGAGSNPGLTFDVSDEGQLTSTP
jgi:hypothetical protein